MGWKERKPFYIILNPCSGAGKGQRYLPALRDLAKRKGGSDK